MGMKPRRRPKPAEAWGAGDPSKWEPLTFPDKTKQLAQIGLSTNPVRVPLVFGEHPHSRRENNIYALEPGGKSAIDFDGYRVAVRLEIEEYNYLKSSGLTGSEIRGLCHLRVRFNGRLVYGDGFRRADQACAWWLANAYKLFEHPVRLWWGEGSDFPDLIGRKISYKDIPAIVTRYFPDQGSAIIEADGPEAGEGFPRIPLNDDEPTEYEPSAKVNILQEEIWWFRE